MNKHPHTVIAKFLSSPSAKRRIGKDKHYLYCNNLCVTGNDLEDHLTDVQDCAIEYFSALRLKFNSSVALVSARFFNCIYCNTTQQMRRHMLNERDCFEKYKLKYDVSSVKEIISKIRANKINTGQQKRICPKGIRF